MALPDFPQLIAGTSRTWKASGGDKVLTLTSLANAAARQGDKSATLIDGTLGVPEALDFRFEWSCVSAPANGTFIELWVAASDNATAGSDNPGTCTGADGAFATPAEFKLQLDYVGALALSNNAGTAVQKQRFRYLPDSGIILPFLCPVVVNQSGVAGSATAGNFNLVMTPYYRKIAD